MPFNSTIQPQEAGRIAAFVVAAFGILRLTVTAPLRRLRANK